MQVLELRKGSRKLNVKRLEAIKIDRIKEIRDSLWR